MDTRPGPEGTPGEQEPERQLPRSYGAAGAEDLW